MMKSNNKPAAMLNIVVWRGWTSIAILRSRTVAGDSVTILFLPDVLKDRKWVRKKRHFAKISRDSPLKVRGLTDSLYHTHTESISSVTKLILPFC